MSALVTPSLLDRLTDDARPPVASSAEFIRSVVRDLNDLVNTLRVDLREIPEHLIHVRTSLLAYGLSRPGLLGKSKQDRERVRADLRETILRFEPRILSVDVRDALAPRPDAPDESASMNAYSFKIIAVLNTTPVPTEVLLGATFTRYPEAIFITPGIPEGAAPEQERSDAG